MSSSPAPLAPILLDPVTSATAIDPIRPTSLTDVLRNLHTVLAPTPPIPIAHDAWTTLTAEPHSTLQAFQSAFERMCQAAWNANLAVPTDMRHALVSYWRQGVALMAKQYERLVAHERISPLDRNAPRVPRPWLHPTVIAHRKEDRSHVYSGVDRSGLPPQEPDGKHTFRLALTERVVPESAAAPLDDDPTVTHTLGQLIKSPTTKRRASQADTASDPISRRPHKLMRFLDFGPYASFAPTLDGSNAQIDALDSQAVLVGQAANKDAADAAFRSAVVQAGRVQLHLPLASGESSSSAAAVTSPTKTPGAGDLLATYLGMLAEVQSARLLADPHLGPVPEEVALARRIERLLCEAMGTRAPRDLVQDMQVQVEPLRQLVSAPRPRACVKGTLPSSVAQPQPQVPLSALGFVDPGAMAAGKVGMRQADATKPAATGSHKQPATRAMHPPAGRPGTRPIAAHAAAKLAPPPAMAATPHATTPGQTGMSPPTVPRMSLPPTPQPPVVPSTPYHTPHQQQQQAAMYSAMLAQQHQFQQQQQRVAAAAAMSPVTTSTTLYTPTSGAVYQAPQWSNPPSGSVTPVLAPGYRVPTQGTGGSVVSTHSTGGGAAATTPPLMPVTSVASAGTYGYPQSQQQQQQAYLAQAQAQMQMQMQHQQMYQQQQHQFAQQQQPGGMVYPQPQQQQPM